MRINELQPFKSFSIQIPEESRCKIKADELGARDAELKSDIDVEFIAKTVIEGQLSDLHPRDKRKLPFYLLHEKFEAHNPLFAKHALKKNSLDNKFVQKLFNSWISNYDTASKQGKIVNEFLSKNQKNLSQENKILNNRFSILKGIESNNPVIKEFINKEIGEKSLSLIGLSSSGLTSKRFSTAFLYECCNYIRTNNLKSTQIDNIIDIFARNEVVHESLRDTALVSLICGVKNLGITDVATKKVRDIVQKNYDDPRVELKTWPSIPDVIGGQRQKLECVDKVKQWKIFQSIHIFFKIIDRVKAPGDVKHHFPQRKKFWENYFNRGFVSDAWVAFGSEGDCIAQLMLRNNDIEIEGLQWGCIAGESSRSVLMMKIGTLTIMEWSHSGACRIWDSTDNKAPKLLKKRYQTQDFMNDPTRHDKVTHTANGSWKQKLKRIIDQDSGVRRTV